MALTKSMPEDEEADGAIRLFQATSSWMPQSEDLKRVIVEKVGAEIRLDMGSGASGPSAVEERVFSAGQTSSLPAIADKRSASGMWFAPRRWGRRSSQPTNKACPPPFLCRASHSTLGEVCSPAHHPSHTCGASITILRIPSTPPY